MALSLIWQTGEAGNRTCYPWFTRQAVYPLHHIGSCKPECKKSPADNTHECQTVYFCLFCCFTSQVNSYGHCGTVSSPSHTFSWAGLNKRLTSNSCTYIRLLLTTTLLEWISRRRRMTVEIISWSISTKVWDRTGIELETPESAVRHASVARHVTNCATRPGFRQYIEKERASYPIILKFKLWAHFWFTGRTMILLGHFYGLIWESFPIQTWPIFSQFQVF